MKILTMHRHDAQSEAGVPPPPELVASMGAFIGEYAQRGQFLDGAGLRASATRTRLTFRGGECTVKRGPYRGDNELPRAILQLTVKSQEQAIDWGRRYGKVLGDGELEIGPLNEPWDLGLMPRPDDAPLRVLLIEKADAASEAGTRSAKQKADLTRLAKEMTAAGVLTSSVPLRPSREGKRLLFRNHDLQVVDGPFAESKELVGGFALMELPSLDDAVAMSRRYAEILGGTLEMDLRPVED
jgi:hypothetical protein